VGSVRVAALDRRPDLAAVVASAFFGTVVGAAFTAGFLAGRLTARSTP
jgi:flagellar motor component MotA